MTARLTRIVTALLAALIAVALLVVPHRPPAPTAGQLASRMHCRVTATYHGHEMVPAVLPAPASAVQCTDGADWLFVVEWRDRADQDFVERYTRTHTPDSLVWAHGPRWDVLRWDCPGPVPNLDLAVAQNAARLLDGSVIRLIGGDKV